MGHIKEPRGVDLLIGPSTLTERDRRLISEIIADYKRTGKLPRQKKVITKRERTAPVRRKKSVSKKLKLKS